MGFTPQSVSPQCDSFVTNTIWPADAAEPHATLHGEEVSQFHCNASFCFASIPPPPILDLVICNSNFLSCVLVLFYYFTTKELPTWNLLPCCLSRDRAIGLKFWKRCANWNQKPTESDSPRALFKASNGKVPLLRSGIPLANAIKKIHFLHHPDTNWHC